MKTNLCHMLGIEHPIIAAPMGPDLTGPYLTRQTVTLAYLSRTPSRAAEESHVEETGR